MSEITVNVGDVFTNASGSLSYTVVELKNDDGDLVLHNSTAAEGVNFESNVKKLIAGNYSHLVSLSALAERSKDEKKAAPKAKTKAEVKPEPVAEVKPVAAPKGKAKAEPKAAATSKPSKIVPRKQAEPPKAVVEEPKAVKPVPAKAVKEPAAKPVSKAVAAPKAEKVAVVPAKAEKRAKLDKTAFAPAVKAEEPKPTAKTRKAVAEAAVAPAIKLQEYRVELTEDCTMDFGDGKPKVFKAGAVGSAAMLHGGVIFEPDAQEDKNNPCFMVVAYKAVKVIKLH